MIDQQRWIRDDEDRGKKLSRKQRPYEKKDSFKWQKSSENIKRRLGAQMAKVISVYDREADVYECIAVQADAHREICCQSNAEPHFDDPITVNILIAEEINYDTKDRLRLILLTSESVETFKECRTALRFYELCWRIEEFHKARKTGTGVERLRLLCAGNVQRLTVILMFVAVRLLQIREALMLPYSRKQKDDKIWNDKTPASRVVSDEEWKA